MDKYRYEPEASTAMNEELRTPDEEAPLLAAEHGGFFRVYRDPPTVELGELDGATISLVYDGNPRPRLTVDREGIRAVIDVETATIAKGVLHQDVLEGILEYAAENRDALGEVWAGFHDSAREMTLELEAVATELTDPNDIELDD